MSKEYINRELLENALEDENKNGNFVFTANWIMEIVDNLPTADVAPKSEVDMSQHLLKDAWKRIEELDNLCGELQKAKAEVAKTFRKRMNEKMGKHTHLLGKEYVQRIMREVEKELIGEEDA
jgi:hypothetical protein